LATRATRNCGRLGQYYDYGCSYCDQRTPWHRRNPVRPDDAAAAGTWLIDDVVFTVFYLQTRNTPVCIAAHAIANLIASSLVALGFAR
jgi:hypothetical protein